jgi:hypothetical protein
VGEKMGMKILMTYTRDSHLLAPQFFKAFRSQGIDVRGTSYLDTLQQMLGSSFFNNWMYRVFPYMVHRKLNRQLLHDVKRHHPHILWIFKGMEIWPRTLRKIKSMGIKLVNYNPDHPFRYGSRGSGNENVRKSIPVYDLHMTYSQRIEQELKQKFGELRTFYLPFGYPRDVERMSFSEEEIMRICFVGHADHHRATIIRQISDAGEHIDLYGPNWRKYFTDTSINVQCFDPVYGDAYWKTLHQYRVQLNLFRDHNTGSHNMRTFEVPAVGGIMLANYSAEQTTFFEEGKEAFYFNTVPELIQKVRKILQLSADEARRIRNAARHRSLTSNYSYDQRGREVAQLFNSLLHE